MDAVGDGAFVVDDGGGVDDDAVAEGGFGADDGGGADDDAEAEFGGGGDVGGGVDGVDGEEVVVAEVFEVGLSGAVVADGDDGVFEFLLAEFGEEVGLAEDGEAGERGAGEDGVGVEEADGFVDAGGAGGRRGPLCRGRRRR